MRSALLWAPLVAPCLCLADAQPVQLATLLDPVIVTPTRSAQPASETAAATVVIDRAEIERAQATDVAQLLARETGLEIGRSGGPGQPASLFVRGGNSNYVLVLLDGVRVNEGSLGLPALNNITPEMIERIEVLQGPRAALYGADAVSGVVNIITRQAGASRADAALSGGSFGTAGGAVSGRTEGRIGDARAGLVGTAQVSRSDGIPTFAGSDDDRGFRNRTLSGRATLALGGVQLEARGWDAGGNIQYSNTVYDQNFQFAGFAPLDHDFHNQTLALAATATPLPGWQSELTLSRGEDKLAENQGSDYVRTVRPGANWHNVVQLGSLQRLSFGALGYRERVDASSFGLAIAEARTNVYGYLQDEVSLDRHRLLAAVSYLGDSQFGKRFNWNAEYSYALFPATRLIATAGSAFHAPTAYDRFGGFGGNPDLQPEKALTYEVAARQAIGAAQSAELRLFRTDVRDLIAFVPPNFTAVNVQHSRNEGLQASWRYADGPWQARVAGLWQNPRNRDTDSRLLRRSRLSATAEVVRRFEHFELGADLRSQGSRPDVGAIDFAPTRNGGYALLGLSASAPLGAGFRLDLRGDNVLNHRYQTVSGYNQPGAAVYATLRWTGAPN